MSEYFMSYDGQHDMAWVESAIQGEEALATRFVSNQLSPIDGKIVNVAKFEEANSVPEDIRLQPHGQGAPANHVLVWAGVMLLEGQNTAVDAYRPV
jgi:hypothetical protein